MWNFLRGGGAKFIPGAISFQNLEYQELHIY